MAIPVPVSIGATVSSVDPLQVPLPLNLQTDDLLVLPIENRTGVPDLVPTITDAAGGTWVAAGPNNGSNAGNTTRLTVLTSRYNGTQTAPTISDTGDHQQARIIAIRGCDYSSGSAVHGALGNAPTFAESVSNITALTTTVVNCLILDIIAGEQPDVDGGAVFSNWTNAALTNLTELADASTSTGLGGSLAINAGGLATPGDTGVTVVSHGNWRVAYKKLAISGLPGVLQHIDKNARGQVLIDGIPRFLRGIYDAGAAGVNASDWAGHNAVRNFARFKLDWVINIHAGVGGLHLSQADSLSVAPLNMYCGAVANINNQDAIANPSYNYLGTVAPFQTHWVARNRAMNNYTADEPPHSVASRDNVIAKYNQMKSQMPTLPVIITMLNDNFVQWREWVANDTSYGNSPVAAGQKVADWMGCDIYVIGKDPELWVSNQTQTIPSTYGYMNFNVGEAVALARYYCNLAGMVPTVVLQLNKFGSASRYPTLSEIWSHWVIAMAELRGVGMVIWWAMGTQDGALDQENFITYTSGSQAPNTVNGTNKVFEIPTYVEEAVDVRVMINGVIQSQSTYTIQNLGDTQVVFIGNFWEYVNRPKVTFNTAPLVTDSVTVFGKRWPSLKRAAALTLLETMTTLGQQLESIMLQPSDPTLITFNSTESATFLAWRLGTTNTMRAGTNPRPCWLEGSRLRYDYEFNQLSLATPVFDASVHMMDQKANVRTSSWESATTGIVAAYNYHPNFQAGVTLRWHKQILRVEVLNENRDVPVNADGLSWTDSFGGASSMRTSPTPTAQDFYTLPPGGFNQGHLYRLTIGGSSPSGGGAAITGASPGVVRSTVLRPGAFVRGT